MVNYRKLEQREQELVIRATVPFLLFWYLQEWAGVSHVAEIHPLWGLFISHKSKVTQNMWITAVWIADYLIEIIVSNESKWKVVWPFLVTATRWSKRPAEEPPCCSYVGEGEQDLLRVNLSWPQFHFVLCWCRQEVILLSTLLNC